MLRWAILGTGFISKTVTEAIALSDGSRVEIIAGRDSAKTADFRARHGVPRAASYDQAIADPDIDVIYIGLPNHQHHPFAIAAAEAGKAVVSEKSLTTTMESAAALVAAARQHDTFFVEGLMYLAHPIHQTFGRLLTDGRVGALHSINGRYGADIAKLVNPAGRGTIFNLGCYPVSLTQFVVQTMLGETAFTDREVAATGVVDRASGTVSDAALVVRFGDCVLATLQSSDSYGNSSDFSVAGDHGVLRFVTNPWLPVAGDNIVSWQPHDGDVEQIVVHDPYDAFYHQVKMVEHHVAAGHTEAARPSPRLLDSMEIMALLTQWEALCLARLPDFDGGA